MTAVRVFYGLFLQINVKIRPHACYLKYTLTYEGYLFAFFIHGEIM